MRNRKRLALSSRLVLGTLVVLLVACSRGKSEECVESPDAKNKAQKVTRISLGKNKKEVDPNADWCRTCVMGPKGWASCQIAFAEKMGEDRAHIKERALENACLDAGFKKGECPKSAVKAVTCKDDAPPEGAEKASETLQKIFLNSKGIDNPKNSTAPQEGNSGENTQ